MKRHVIWLVAAGAVIVTSAVLVFNRPKEVQTSTASAHDFTTFIEGAGLVDAPKQVVVVPANGLVKSVPVKEGQSVAAGAAVLEMDDEALRLQLEQATLALNAKKKAAEDQNDALADAEKQGVLLAAQTTGYGLEQFEQTVRQAAGTSAVSSEQIDAARLQVQQVAYMMDQSVVRSAIAGKVLEVSVRAGEYAAAGAQAVLLASMGDVEIDSVFSDQDAASIEPGMEVLLYGGCLGDGESGGVVGEIVPKAQTEQSQTGMKSTAVIKIKPENSGLFTRLGASVELKVITGRKSAVGVPIEALAQDSSGLYVFVIRGGKAFRTPVEVGVLDETCAEMLSGVRKGDVVALNPTELRNGQKVSGT